MDIFSRSTPKETNPLDEKKFSSLTASIDWSEQRLAYPRKKRIEAIKQYTGKHYMEGGSDKIMPINISKLAVDIYLRQLIARAPRVLITTKEAKLKATAANFELAINQIPQEIRLADTLRRFVLEALFSMGILKIGLADSSSVLGHPYGETFVDNVTMDDYFLDLTAKSFQQIQYEGNSYWLDYEMAMESGLVKAKDKRDIKPDEYTATGFNGEETAGGITNSGSAEVYRDRLHLRDVWLPTERLLVTYGVTSKKLLNVVEWEGPELGPYTRLGFSEVPGNILPLPPVSIWRDLDDLCNALLRKLGNQADSQKTVQGFNTGDDEGVNAFKQAADGSGITYTGSEPKTLTAGGVDPRTLAFFLQAKQLTSYIAGNLDSLGGLAPMTQTIGQDRLLTEAASAQLQDMSGRTIDAIKDVFYALAFYEWNDPIKSRTLEKKAPDTDITIPVEWNQDSKEGDIDLFDLKIDVFSMLDDSPQVKLQKIGMLIGQYIVPLMPLIQAQQGTVDVEKLLRDVAKYSDLPEYVMFSDQPVQMPSGSGGAGGAGGAQGGPPPRAAQGSGLDAMTSELMSM